MADVLKARDDKDVVDAVRWALSDGKALELVGCGSKRALGRPSQTDFSLDLSALAGVTLYEPEELVLSARAGTPLAEIESLLLERNQQLDFEPMDYGPILGVAADGGSIGGALAANLSGPRRIKAGAARDHFLGVNAVSGRGEVFKAGGRVVKNVTGYDLCKLLAGSYGTLAAMTDVTVKTLPRPETETTVLTLGLDAARAGEAMTVAMGSSCDVSGAAHLPVELIHHVEGLHVTRSATVFRLEGVSPSVKHRGAALAALLKPFGAVEFIEETYSRALWRGVRDARPFSAAGRYGDWVLWRLSVVPAKGGGIAALIPPDAQMFHDWAGGLIWLVLPPSDDAGAAAVRRAAKDLGGHATLIRAPAAVRAAIDVFEPQSGALAGVSKRVKEGFDPKGVLNPGRMWAGV